MRRACKWMGATWLGVALLGRDRHGVGRASGGRAARTRRRHPRLPVTRAPSTTHTTRRILRRIRRRRSRTSTISWPKIPTLRASCRIVYRDYYLTYYQLKNYPQAIAYADKELELGDKVDFGTRVEA